MIKLKFFNFLLLLLIGACTTASNPKNNPEEYIPASRNEIIYNRIRFTVIDLYDVEQLSKKYVLAYFGTDNNYHLLVALPSDKFSFNETQHFALHASECDIPDSYYPEQSLFYNLTEVKNWKAIKVSNGVCIIMEDTQLRFLFD